MKIKISVVRAVRSLAALGAMAIAAAACSGGGSSSSGGSGEPGDMCGTNEDCGCWECTCSSSVEPGNACVGNVCPTGDAACEILCGLLSQTFVSSAPGTGCP